MNNEIETSKPNGHKPFESNGPREKREGSYGGIKFFKGAPLPNHGIMLDTYRSLSLETLRETHKVWRPEETLEAAKPFFEEGRVNVVGAPQSGKGTILFGLSEICDQFGWGYVFIDGHHQETPAEQVVATIQEAEERGIPIFYDSLDYLFAGYRKIRDLPKEKQEKRTPKIMNALVNVKVPLAITHHDEEWAKLFLDPQLVGRFSDQIRKFPVYRIPDSFQSPESIRRFLLDQNVPPQEAEFLSQFPWNKPKEHELVILFDRLGKENPDQFVKTVFAATASFPVLKELVRDARETFMPFLIKIANGSVDEKDLAGFAETIWKAETKRTQLAKIRWDKR